MTARRTAAGGARGLPWWAALLCAAAGGLLLDAAAPGFAWWPALFLGAPLVLAAFWQQRMGVGAAAGAVAGAAFWLPHISWLTLYLGPIPWLGLGTAMILWFVLLGIAVALTTRGLARIPWFTDRPPLLAVAQAAASAGLWVMREQLQSVVPYGGFAWGRLAHTQAESPIAQAVSWLGFAGLSGALALACALPIAVVFLRARRRRPMTVLSLAAVALVLLLAVVPAAPLPDSGSLRVAAVQGDSKAGIFDDRDSGDVLQDHLEGTEALLEHLDETDEQVDLVVWPENSAEFGIDENLRGGQRIAELAEQADAPVVIGSVLRNPDGTYTNSALVWTRYGFEGERYDKRRPVPFAEYMPNRDFFHSLVPDLVDLVQLEYRAGTLPASMPMDLAGTRVSAGIAICFDIIFDDHAVAMQRSGAQFILAPTNNADFGRTDESAQQLAIARLRAIEMGRALVNISTVGTSAVVAPDGSDLDRLEPFTADFMVAEIPVREGETPALRLGAWIAGSWILLGVAGFGTAAVGILRPDEGEKRSGSASAPLPQ